MTWLGRQLKEVVPVRSRAGELGVEVEVEATNMTPRGEMVDRFWAKTMDGSLRGRDSAEYVLRKPMSYNDTITAIRYLEQNIKEFGTNMKDTVRAGVHIHINMTSEKILNMMKFLTCYYILEEVLTDKLCGEGRSGNHFCLRAIDGELQLFDLCKSIKEEEFMWLRSDNIRYAACNLSSILKHGSLEFRALRTPTDFNKIKIWIDILRSIRENSQLFENPVDIVEQFSMGGERNFLERMLRENTKHLGTFDEEMSFKLMQGTRLAQEIAYSRKEWK